LATLRPRATLGVDPALEVVRERLGRELAALARLNLAPTTAPGKLLRARLLLTVAATVVGEAPTTDRATSLAAAVELLHLATLHHDDVLDDSPHRRRMASARRIFGNKVSILFGDALVASAFDTLLRCASRRMQFAVVRALTVTVRGEIEQQLNHRTLDVDAAACVRVARLKTGSLFALSAGLGALLGGDPGAAADARRLGRRLGTAYQLIDDALDYAGDYDDLGKAPGADYREGIATLPLVLAWRSVAEGDREVLRAGFGRGESGDFAAVRDLVVGGDHFVSCLAEIRRRLDLVRRSVIALSSGPPSRLLMAYVDQIQDRLPDPCR
jgi:octaprenyl-diphosphate synthase